MFKQISLIEIGAVLFSVLRFLLRSWVVTKESTEDSRKVPFVSIYYLREAPFVSIYYNTEVQQNKSEHSGTPLAVEFKNLGITRIMNLR